MGITVDSKGDAPGRKRYVTRNIHILTIVVLLLLLLLLIIIIIISSQIEQY